MALHNDFGHWGEEVAADYLRSQGYTILHRNYRVGHRDLDIVALRDDVLVFVEVKTRRNEVFASAESAADEQKMRRIAAAARTYMHEKGLWQPYRFDVIAVVGEAPPFTLHHHRFAYRPHRA